MTTTDEQTHLLDKLLRMQTACLDVQRQLNGKLADVVDLLTPGRAEERQVALQTTLANVTNNQESGQLKRLGRYLVLEALPQASGSVTVTVWDRANGGPLQPTTDSAGQQTISAHAKWIVGGVQDDYEIKCTGVSGSWTVLIGYTDSAPVGVGAGSTNLIEIGGAAISTDGSGNLGTFGPVSQNPAITPPISESAYSAGDVVGGVLNLGAVMRVANGGGQLVSASVLDASNEKAPFDILLFSQNPSNGTYTDHAAFTGNAADMGYCLGRISFAASAYNTDSTYGLAAAPSGVPLVVKASGTQQHLYAIVVTSGAPTYATTSALTFLFGILPD